VSESAKRECYVRQPRRGDAIRTGRHGDVTVDSVIGHGQRLLATDVNGKQHVLHRADEERWLRIERVGAVAGIPDTAVQAAAEVLLRQSSSESDASHLTWRNFADAAREVLGAALPHLGSRD
jgi:hypothetical protein